MTPATTYLLGFATLPALAIVWGVFMAYGAPRLNARRWARRAREYDDLTAQYRRWLDGAPTSADRGKFSFFAEECERKAKNYHRAAAGLRVVSLDWDES